MEWNDSYAPSNQWSVSFNNCRITWTYIKCLACLSSHLSFQSHEIIIPNILESNQWRKLIGWRIKRKHVPVFSAEIQLNWMFMRFSVLFKYLLGMITAVAHATSNKLYDWFDFDYIELFVMNLLQTFWYIYINVYIQQKNHGNN